VGFLRRLFRARDEGTCAGQARHEALHKQALRGMNMGTGDDLAASGEAHLLDALGRELLGHAGVVAFDVGANKGDYSARLLQAWGASPGLTVYACEPSPSLHAALALRFPSAGAVRVLPFGLGAREEDRTLHLDAPGSGLGSLYARDLAHRGLALGRTETVRLRTLDDVCAEQRIERIELLKLDVEGHELAVLEGGRRMLDEGRIRRIQFEFGGCHVDARVFLRDFWNLLSPRYAIARVLQDGLQPVERYNERLEVFVTTNYLATLKPGTAARGG
jgi:FkbM family methyltransferase